MATYAVTFQSFTPVIYGKAHKTGIVYYASGSVVSESGIVHKTGIVYHSGMNKLNYNLTPPATTGQRWPIGR